MSLVITCEYYTLSRGLSGNHTYSRGLVALEWYATDGCLCFLLDLLFGLGGSVPMGKYEAALFDLFLELFVGVDSACE